MIDESSICYNELLYLANGNLARLNYALNYAKSCDIKDNRTTEIENIIEYIKISNFISDKFNKIEDELKIRDLVLNIINGENILN